MIKKKYEKPSVTKVELKIKHSLLASCNNSPTIMDPKIGPIPCAAETGCYNP